MLFIEYRILSLCTFDLKIWDCEFEVIENTFLLLFSASRLNCLDTAPSTIFSKCVAETNCWFSVLESILLAKLTSFSARN